MFGGAVVQTLCDQYVRACLFFLIVADANGGWEKQVSVRESQVFEHMGLSRNRGTPPQKKRVAFLLVSLKTNPTSGTTKK